MGYGPTLTMLEAGHSYKAVVPQKIPVGGSVSASKKPGLFKVYFPMSNGGALELKTSAGVIDVYAPDGSPAVDERRQPVAAGAEVKFEVPDGQNGWFGVVVRDASQYRVEASIVLSGNARDRDRSMLVPWNFFYFPYSQVHQQGNGHPAMKWQQKFGGKAGDWERTSYWQSEIKGGDDGVDGHAITEEFVADYNKFTGRSMKYEDTDWWGHCDAAASASALFRQPQATGNFSESDMEYFATEITMRGYDLKGAFHLGGIDGPGRSAPSNKEVCSDQLGQAVDADIGPFHEALIECVKKLGAPALMDFRSYWDGKVDRSSEVWNQVVYKFSAKARQARPDTPGGDEEESARALEFHNILTANADRPPSESTGDPETGIKWVRELDYVLHYDAKGKVITNHAQNNYKKVIWRTTEYYPPRYIFQIKGLQDGGRGKGNPHINLGQAQQLGLQKRALFGG